MQKSALAFFILAAVAAISVTPARAGIEYPWCAQYSGSDDGGHTNCGFVTIEQCRATISGIGGFCVPNQFYTGTDKTPAKRKRNTSQPSSDHWPLGQLLDARFSRSMKKRRLVTQ